MNYDEWLEKMYNPEPCVPVLLEPDGWHNCNNCFDETCEFWKEYND